MKLNLSPTKLNDASDVVATVTICLDCPMVDSSKESGVQFGPLSSVCTGKRGAGTWWWNVGNRWGHRNNFRSHSELGRLLKLMCRRWNQIAWRSGSAGKRKTDGL